MRTWRHCHSVLSNTKRDFIHQLKKFKTSYLQLKRWLVHFAKIVWILIMPFKYLLHTSNNKRITHSVILSLIRIKWKCWWTYKLLKYTTISDSNLRKGNLSWWYLILAYLLLSLGQLCTILKFQTQVSNSVSVEYLYAASNYLY